ncbi:MAG: hypothetical protein ABH869_02245 [Candidatus Omnitrophota bacterium]
MGKPMGNFLSEKRFQYIIDDMIVTVKSVSDRITGGFGNQYSLGSQGKPKRKNPLKLLLIFSIKPEHQPTPGGNSAKELSRKKHAYFL